MIWGYSWAKWNIVTQFSYNNDDIQVKFLNILINNDQFCLNILMTWYIMIGFEQILVLAILAKILGPHNMCCASQSNLWIDAGIML
jgi:hypothetical protein